jgi:hypothetical protein
MAVFEITVDGACKGKPEDIAIMKKRLTALFDAGKEKLLNDPQFFRELFEDVIKDIEKRFGETFDAESERYSTLIDDLFYEWQYIDVDSLQFSGNSHYKDAPGDYIESFLSALHDIFYGFVEFSFISWCYISWGHFVCYLQGEESCVDFEWDEERGGKEKKDAYLKWKLAERAVWLLPDDAPAETRNAAQKAADEAEAEFNRLNEEDDEDEDDEDDDED